jgi:hypothetical protein
MKRIVSLFVLICLLSIVFSTLEKVSERHPPQLENFLPAPLQKTVLGFFKQIGAETEFILLEVFLGTASVRKYLPPTEYEENLAYNFTTITDIHPHFLDFFYLCQSSLSYISPESAITTSTILLKGAKANHDNILLKSWAAFNYFFYAHNNKKAASIYLDLAKKNGAPRWFGHLAAVLNARDGNLQSSIMALKMMLATATKKYEKQRYEKDLGIFKKALQVSWATQRYEKKYLKKPNNLTELVPEFLPRLPETGDQFTLHWNGTRVTLVRPNHLKKQSSPKNDIPLIFQNASE